MSKLKDLTSVDLTFLESESRLTVTNDKKCRLFALIIAIDVFKDTTIPQLTGATNDAKEVEDFLISQLSVPKDRILNLRNKEATRTEMLEAMKSLAENESIRPTDPILIYYAGHGAEARPPFDNWPTSSSNGMVQMLVPHDFISQGSKNKHGQGILDIEISQILQDISRKKSDNITVIFDCCHSGSATRDGNLRNAIGQTLAVRGIELPPSYAILAGLVSPELRGRSARRTSSSGLKSRDFPESEKSTVESSPGAGTTETRSSHVLLAACRQGESAMEWKHRGAFTVALLSLFKREGIEKLTYTDVVKHLPNLQLQTPQCEGANQNRILFDSKVYRRQRIMYDILTAPTHNEYTLQAGEACGITKGAVFSVYSDRLATCFLGSVVVNETDNFTSQCSVLDGNLSGLYPSAYAIQTRVGDAANIRLFIERKEAFRDLFRLLNDRANLSKRPFHLVDSRQDQPDLVVTEHEGRVQFEVHDQSSRQFGLTHMSFNDVDPEPGESAYILAILRRAAHFHWHLHHSNKIRTLADTVHVECLELESIFVDGNEIRVPKQGGQNLAIDNTIIIDYCDTDTQRIWGYKITNLSKRNLHVALFHFDASSLKI
ncbi:hypothetical protein H0H87_002783, partial [Tephrocybe sp. NHM501043]